MLRSVLYHIKFIQIIDQDQMRMRLFKKAWEYYFIHLNDLSSLLTSPFLVLATIFPCSEEM